MHLWLTAESVEIYRAYNDVREHGKCDTHSAD